MVITSYQLCELDLCLSENLNLPPLSTMRESFFFLVCGSGSFGDKSHVHVKNCWWPGRHST